jgi:hypothetical protein
LKFDNDGRIPEVGFYAGKLPALPIVATRLPSVEYIFGLQQL